jgi:hypothetical protein
MVSRGKVRINAPSQPWLSAPQTSLRSPKHVGVPMALAGRRMKVRLRVGGELYSKQKRLMRWTLGTTAQRRHRLDMTTTSLPPLSLHATVGALFYDVHR